MESEAKVPVGPQSKDASQIFGQPTVEALWNKRLREMIFSFFYNTQLVGTVSFMARFLIDFKEFEGP